MGRLTDVVPSLPALQGLVQWSGPQDAGAGGDGTICPREEGGDGIHLPLPSRV